MTQTSAYLKTRLAQIQKMISLAARHSGRDPNSIHLIAVSKKQPVEDIIYLAKLGQLDFGENYVQELLDKQSEVYASSPELAKKIRWHFVGHLQSNKAKDIVGRVDSIHSIDSIKIAKKISQIASATSCQQKVLLQINLGMEKSKTGFLAESLQDDLPELSQLPCLAWAGLMAIPPATTDRAIAQQHFIQLRSLLDGCIKSGLFSSEMKELSMGMSADFEIALSEGATILRIGTALFGERT